jgi:hypothetical protein
VIELGRGVLRTCEGVSRRRLLTVGGLGVMGLTLGDALRAEAAQTPAASERSCIFVWLDGGPSQYETFDPKPEAPVEIRGPYGAIETNVSGIRISELLPTLARQMDKFSIIRTFTHGLDRHSPVHVMAGTQANPTSFGAVVTALKERRGTLPPYVRLGSAIGGVGGGRLGAAFDPVQVEDPTAGKVAIPDFNLPTGVATPRFDRRRGLLDQVDWFRRGVDADRTLGTKEAAYQKAMALLTSSQVREAFDLSREAPALRSRYGANKFGQSCLLARRLVEAGTRFVEIKWFGDVDSSAYDSWDVHGADLPGLSRLEHQLCPRLDMAFASLVRDLHDRGLLESTLVVALGEFGRTPRINPLGGRDHWPPAQSVFIAGAGVPPGTVIGSTDAEGAYPASRPVSLNDFIVTFFRILGLNANVDDRLRPFVPAGNLVDEIVSTA